MLWYFLAAVLQQDWTMLSRQSASELSCRRLLNSNICFARSRGLNLIIDTSSQAAKDFFAMPTVLPVIRSLDQVLSGNSPGSATA